MAALASTAELIVAATADRLAGAVAYVGPHRPKGAFLPYGIYVKRR
jgi:hypothetical protein